MPVTQDHGNTVLEVIACSLPDAVEAERGGAGRLEVVRDLDRGGLTPELPLVRAIARAVSLPLRVMLRENDDDSAHADDTHLRATALELEQIGVDGVVIGFLKGGHIDLERTLRVLEPVPQLGVTFHHAFDETASPPDAITRLKECGRFDRILSRGGWGELQGRAIRLEEYRRQAGEEIVMMAGGNLDEASIRFLRKRTGLREFHVGRAARFPHSNSGVVRSDLVTGLRELLSNDDRPILQSSGGGGRVNE